MIGLPPKVDFFYGEWDINEENLTARCIIKKNKTLSWTLNNFDLLVNEEFIVSEKAENKVTIEGEQGKKCFRFTFEKTDSNQALVCNYKCWIDKGMIDEVMVARKSVQEFQVSSKPNKEIISLPDGYVGKFHIIYDESNNRHSNKVVIDKTGIGYSQGEIQFKQLFNANRVFKYAKGGKEIPILNPKKYGCIEREELKNITRSSALGIIQLGYNQSAREYFNTDQNLKIRDNINIEYFEIVDLEE